jgi:hypothetical protein
MKKKYVILEKSLEGKIIEFLVKYPYPPDEEIHALAKKLKINPGEFESRIYGLLSDIIEHGQGLDNPNPKELEMGIQVELEHTHHPEIAKYIALAHLKEDEKYYTHLEEMEDKYKKKH